MTELQTVSFNVAVDKTVPTVAITTEGESTIKLTFSKDIKGTSVSASIKNAATGVLIDTLTFTGSGKEFKKDEFVPAFGSTTTASYIVEIKKDVVEDTLGNKMDKASQTITFTKDATKPVLESIIPVMTTDGKKVDKLVVTASKKLSDTYGPVGTITVVDNKTGAPVTDGKFTATPVVKDNTITFDITDEVISGQYTFNFPADYVQDTTTVSKNKNAATSLVYDFGAAAATTEELKATVTTSGVNVFTVTFDKTVKLDSATNATNYTLNGTAISAKSITLDSTQTIVTITLNDNTITDTNSAAYLTVSGVVSYKGATVTPTTQKVTVTDNTAPTIKSATVTKDGVVVTFSETVDTPVKAKFLYKG